MPYACKYVKNNGILDFELHSINYDNKTLNH